MSASFRIFAFLISIGALISNAKADGPPTASQLVGEWAIQTVTITDQTKNQTTNVFGTSQLQGGIVVAQAEGALVGNNITIVGDQKRPASTSSITDQEAASLFKQFFASSERIDLGSASPGATDVSVTVSTKLASNPVLAGSVVKTYSLSGDTLTVKTKSTSGNGTVYTITATYKRVP
jgi:hypothetical protein